MSGELSGHKLDPKTRRREWWRRKPKNFGFLKSPNLNVLFYFWHVIRMYGDRNEADESWKSRLEHGKAHCVESVDDAILRGGFPRFLIFAPLKKANLRPQKFPGPLEMVSHVCGVIHWASDAHNHRWHRYRIQIKPAQGQVPHDSWRYWAIKSVN